MDARAKLIQDGLRGSQPQARDSEEYREGAGVLKGVLVKCLGESMGRKKLKNRKLQT